ncbi:MAG: cohesin domain-containing protein, partial [Muribaculaceae bacterium]|nr:cohesin domain-containing protein [Alistipes senegalensis]MCM1474016.1 cohesin domain-containing protein [Muribaculaceae bacterium]
MSIIAMQCTPLEITVVAEESANIALETISVEPGESIDLDLTISNNPGIIAVSVTLEYDSSCLSLKSVDDGALFSGASFTPSGNIVVLFDNRSKIWYNKH